MTLDIRCYEPKVTLFRRMAGVLFAMGASLLLIVGLAVGNLAQFATLLIYPFSPRLFRAANRRLGALYWSECHLLSQLPPINVVMHGVDTIPPEENVILVANHQASVDIGAVFALAYNKRRIGDIKWFVKEMYRWVPGMGLGMMFLGCIFVRRNWTRDRARVERTFRHIVRSGEPFWISMFAEGTRIKPGKQEKSDQMAARYNLPPFRHVLFPATKGFIAATEHLRTRVDAVYDMTIHYPDGIPAFSTYLQGLVRRIDIYVVRHPIASLPTSSEQLAAWLVQRYVEKETLLAKLKSP